MDIAVEKVVELMISVWKKKNAISKFIEPP